MIWPFEPFKIDDEFGTPRSYGFHSGIDFNGIGGGNTDCGYNLKAITSGEIVYASESNTGYGNIVVLRIEGPWGTRWVRYCHCGRILRRSGFVFEGESIALLGSTGNSDVCHLHLDLIKKALANWRTYARTKEILNTYFEDPKSFIEKWVKEDTMPSDQMVSLPADVHGMLVGKADKYDKFVSAGYATPEHVKQLLEDLRRSVDSLRDEKKLAEQEAESRRKELRSLIAELANNLNTRQDVAEILSVSSKLGACIGDLEDLRVKYAEDRKNWALTESELYAEIARLKSLQDSVNNASLEELIGEIIKRLKRLVIK